MPSDIPRLRSWLLSAGVALLTLSASSVGPARAASLAVDVWTDRGDNAVYQPGDAIEIGVRLSDDAFLLVYEIDAVGSIRVLYPHGTRTPFVEGHQTLYLPGKDDPERLVVDGPVGQGYIVAVASNQAFKDLPWYLRPYDAQAEELGYAGGAAPRDSGVTDDGHIVGDPFVAMERIRRQILVDPNDPNTFATAYASYYLHHEVKYPRYLCNDCHRPDYWSWWPGFDPYYTTCSAFTVHVNVGWWWGPSYWYGCVPYYIYAYAPACPPRYVIAGYPWCSSWGGWNQWCSSWGGPLRRYKTVPPAGYVSPVKYEQFRDWRGASRPLPPGYLASAHSDGSTRMTRPGLRGASLRDPIVSRTPEDGAGRPWREGVSRGDGGSARPWREGVSRGASDLDPTARRGMDGDDGAPPQRMGWRGAQRFGDGGRSGEAPGEGWNPTVRGAGPGRGGGEGMRAAGRGGRQGGAPARDGGKGASRPSGDSGGRDGGGWGARGGGQTGSSGGGRLGGNWGGGSTSGWGGGGGGRAGR